MKEVADTLQVAKCPCKRAPKVRVSGHTLGRYNITTGDFNYGSLANPKEVGAELTGSKAS